MAEAPVVAAVPVASAQYSTTAMQVAATLTTANTAILP